MMCRKPYVKAGVPFACGQCMPCRYNRRRMWTGRIMLERLCHGDAAFVTLTYDEEHVHLDAEGRGVLCPKDVQDWLKRLRVAVAPKRIRFYLVGEYGDVTNRPHYHCIIFGLPTCARGRTLRRVPSQRPVWSECCDYCRLFGNTWFHGDVDLGTVTKDSASYVASYTVKKMTSAGDPRLKGRVPEFCRMSLRPGIGADAMWDVASGLLEYRLDKLLVDVPRSLDSGRSGFPLGRYLRAKLRVMIGKDGGTPEEVLEAMAEEMRPLREAAFNSSSSFAEAIISAGDGQVANFEARNAIYRKDKPL